MSDAVCLHRAQRLYRKKKLGTGDNPLQWKLPTSRERHDKKTRKRQEGQEERAWRRKQRRIAPVGTEESVAEVNKRIGRLNVRGEGLEKDLRGLLNVLQNVQAGNSQEFKDEWEEICDRENWSNRTGGSLSRAEPAHSARRTNESDTFDNEAAEVKLIAQLAFGLEGPLYQYFADKLRGRQQRLRALKDDISNELRDTRQQAKKEPDPRRHVWEQAKEETPVPGPARRHSSTFSLSSRPRRSRLSFSSSSGSSASQSDLHDSASDSSNESSDREVLIRSDRRRQGNAVHRGRRYRR